MEFASYALDAHQAANRKIGVGNMFSLLSWRAVVWLRFAVGMANVWCSVSFFLPWLLVRVIAIALSWCGWGNGSFAVVSKIKSWILVGIRTPPSVLHSLCVRYADYRAQSTWAKFISTSRQPNWEVFWFCYLVCTTDIPAFVRDYSEAWKRQPGMDHQIIIFADRINRMAIPCSKFMDDKALLEHARLFYDLARVRRGLFEFMGPRANDRIDIVHVCTPFRH
jgi:hypothetical protein